jgi:hypothetical protein
MVASGPRSVWRTADGGKTWQLPEPAVRLTPYWTYGALALAAACLAALGMAMRHKRPA